MFREGLHYFSFDCDPSVLAILKPVARYCSVESGLFTILYGTEFMILERSKGDNIRLIRKTLIEKGVGLRHQLSSAYNAVLVSFHRHFKPSKLGYILILGYTKKTDV